MTADLRTIQQRPIISEPELDCAEIDPLLQRIFASRGVTSPQQIQYQLGNLENPNQLKGISAATALLEEALRKHQRILIIGDYDADGATSTTVVVLALRALGATFVDYLAPNRFEYGYGLTPGIVELASNRSPDLIITVDNGISSVDGVAAAKALGIKVLITDHHLAGSELPAADAIVNPNQPGCLFNSKAIAGVGVAYYLMIALRGRLRSSGWFDELGIAQPNLADLLDLVALGTVADVVSLDSNNRILVEQGLRRIRAGRARPGLLALIELGNRNLANLVSQDLGFAVGPRLNAAGRLDDISLGIECLLTDDASLAMDMARQLDQLNQDRKQIEQGIQQEALQILSGMQLESTEDLPLGICLYDESWHSGVIGIVASRVKDRVHRPVITFGKVSDTEIKGSGRSVEAVHIRDLLERIATQNPGLIQKYGGHAMAAGLSIAPENYKLFAELFDQAVRDTVNEQQLQAIVITDGELDGQHLNLQSADLMRNAGPWGSGFPEPLFDGEFLLENQKIVGERHLKFRAREPRSGLAIEAIAFNVDLDNWPSTADRARLAYRLDVNEYRGNRSAQLVCDYLEAIGL
ncbi:MAG: single-stranded-DNA-specific exonuclease RecJ [Pseudomonadales bacterium]|nr:single-stranded-DNA-specific exonuclease RecJ [Pseudomonadales bacterium]